VLVASRYRSPASPTAIRTISFQVTEGHNGTQASRRARHALDGEINHRGKNLDDGRAGGGAVNLRGGPIQGVSPERFGQRCRAWPPSDLLASLDISSEGRRCGRLVRSSSRTSGPDGTRVRVRADAAQARRSGGAALGMALTSSHKRPQAWRLFPHPRAPSKSFLVGTSDQRRELS